MTGFGVSELDNIRALMDARSNYKSESENCQFCGNIPGWWSPVCETASGKIIRGISERSYYRASVEYRNDPFVGESVEGCPRCVKSRLNIQLNSSGQKMGDRLISKKIVESWTPYLAPMTQCVPSMSILLYGNTGVGKTLLAKFWFNAILAGRDGSPAKMAWFTERELFNVLGQKGAREEIGAILEKDCIFIDEAYELVNHRDQSGDRSVTAQIKQSNYRHFVNELYESRSHFLCATSNNLPEKVINDAYMQRRHKELFATVINLDDKKYPQGRLL